MTAIPQPVRSSLLFSPVPVDQQSANDVLMSNSPPKGSQSFHGQSNSISVPIISDSNPVASSTDSRHHRRRSDFRSKSTDQIIPGNIPQSSSSVVTAAAVSSGKFTNLNVSQPVLRTAPLPPVPVIPATRFDTITSYVDVIYQHHQQQQGPSLQPNSPSELYPQGDEDPENSLERKDVDTRVILDESNCVYLDPSDGIDGDQSFMATCPQCAMMVMTDIEPLPGHKSRKMACILTPILLCWLPFNFSFGKKWMDVRHSCPKCKSLIAIYRK